MVVDYNDRRGSQDLRSSGQPAAPPHTWSRTWTTGTDGGAEDERGTANLVDADAVRRGLAAVQDGRPISLGRADRGE